MDLSRVVYSRDLKIAVLQTCTPGGRFPRAHRGTCRTAIRALDSGSTTGEIARKYQLSPKLLERWRGEWRAKGESAFPGIGRQTGVPALDGDRRIAELERMPESIRFIARINGVYERMAKLHAEIWRPAIMDDSMTWPAIVDLNTRTLIKLESATLLRRRPQEIYGVVRHEWLFPLFPLDLERVEVKAAVLKEAQQNWYPGDEY